MTKLNDIFESPLTNGIISALLNFNYPWLDDNNIDYINLQYHGNHSGNKIISPLLDNMLKEDKFLTNEQVIQLATIINSMYSTKWNKLYETTILTYNPIHNYDMSEEEIVNDVVETSTNDNGNDKYYGFNTSEPVPNTENTSSFTSNGTKDNTRTLTKSGNIGVTTTQKLLREERELWDWILLDTVFNDIDKILTIQIY